MSEFKIYGQHDHKTIGQMATCMAAGSAAAGVLCADGHLGYAHPIGGVVGYEEHISISGVGFDIACGNMAIKTDARIEDLAPDADKLVAEIASTISFGLGRKNAERIEHELFDSPLWFDACVDHLKQMARDQLGTVGGGNHYVDLFSDEEGAVWIGVHFGSRGLGHKITSQYLSTVGAKDGMEVTPALIELGTPTADGYLAGVLLAGDYAYAGREWVVDRVRRILGAHELDRVHNHHNYVWQEEHQGKNLWVVRKGATPAFPGQRGFVGGSMGDNAVIIEGVDGEESRQALYSTVHGAGRICSRTEAAGKRNKKGEWVRQPRFTRDEMDQWLSRVGVTLSGGDLDESPMAYRRLDEVLAFHSNTIRVLHTLKPFGVVMAGAERDPYKD